MQLRFKHVFFALAALVGAYIVWQMVSVFVWGFQTLNDNSRSIAALADQATLAATADWDPSALKPFADADYAASLGEGSPAAWAVYRTLGEPRVSQPCQVPQLNITNGRGLSRAECPVHFDTFDATIIYELNNLSGDWKIQSFRLLL